MNQNKTISDSAKNNTDIEYSVSPDGEKIALPQKQDYAEGIQTHKKVSKPGPQRK